jgi:hypothetical protein
MENYSSFGMSTKMSSKSKVMAKLQPWEKQNKEAGFYVRISKKSIDGVVKTVFSCDVNGGMKQEFTSIEAFEEYIEKVVESIGKQL